MRRKYAIEIVLSDEELYLLRKLYGKRASCQAQTLVTIAVERAILEAAEKELDAMAKEVSVHNDR